jgi:hypothetical protein
MLSLQNPEPEAQQPPPSLIRRIVTAIGRSILDALKGLAEFIGGLFVLAFFLIGFPLILSLGWFAVASVLTLHLLVAGALALIAAGAWLIYIVYEGDLSIHKSVPLVAIALALIAAPFAAGATTSLGPRLIDQSEANLNATSSLMSSFDGGGSDPGASADSAQSSDAACDPNYSGACVPNTEYDVDCSDVDGSDVEVVGQDVDGLDRDGDGVACESY